MAARKVALVTGANKGMGLGLVRALCRKFDGDVILTARNLQRGKAAVDQLNKEGLRPRFYQLETTQCSSIEKAKNFVESEYGGLDLLINNAGMLYRPEHLAPLPEMAEVTINNNYKGSRDTYNIMYPIFRPGSRIVNISSGYSLVALEDLSAEGKARIREATTVKEVDQFLHDFIRSTKDGTFDTSNWGNGGKATYAMSKLGLNAMTRIHQRELSNTDKHKDTIVNACCTGYVDTDMTGCKGGNKTVEEGIDTPLFLSFLSKDEKNMKGKFVVDREIKEW